MTVLATFPGPDGPVGSADTGQPFIGGRGTVVRRSARGFAENSSPGAYRVVELGAGGYDVDISLQLGGGGGQAIYFREKDTANWWRLSQRYYSYVVDGGTTTYYVWRQYYNDGSAPFPPTNTYSDVTTTSSSPPPSSSFPQSINGYSQYNNATLVNQYSVSNSYTAYAYELLLEKCVAGKVEVVRRTSTNALSSLRVSAKWFELKVFTSASPSTPVWTLQDATHETATRHGFGYAESTQLGNSDGVDGLSITSLNQPPNAPTISLPMVVDRTADLVVNVGFNGKSPSDGAGASYVRWRVEGTTTWTVVSRTSADTKVTIVGGTLPLGEIEVQGASKSAAGLPLADADLVWSASQLTTAAAPPEGFVFTSPAAGSTLPAATQTFTVSVADLDALQYRALGDLDGQPDESVVIDPGATITTGDLRTFTVVGLPNSTTVHVQARAILNTLTVPYTSRQHQVTYTPPAAPLVSDQPVRLGTGDGPDAVAVQLLNPLPTGGAPAAAYNELHRRIKDVGGAGQRLLNPATGEPLEVAPRATYFDPAPHGIAFQWRGRAVAANGTATFGPWSDGPIVVDPDDPQVNDPVTATVEELV